MWDSRIIIYTHFLCCCFVFGSFFLHFLLYNKTWLAFVCFSSFFPLYFFLLTNLKNHNDISALFSNFILYVQCLLKGSCVIRSFIQFHHFSLLSFCFFLLLLLSQPQYILIYYSLFFRVHLKAIYHNKCQRSTEQPANKQTEIIIMMHSIVFVHYVFFFISYLINR